MSETYFKITRSQKTSWLRTNHPNAFLLLCLIAERARRLSGHLDGLEPGDAYIGDYKCAGIETEMKYRTAKALLCELKIIKIKETCRNCKNATTLRTTKGTIATLIDSSICDINPEPNNDHDNDLATTWQRPDNDEQERIRKNKKEVRKKKINKKETLPPVEKIAFREFVLLTQEEHDKLLVLYGEKTTCLMFDLLNAYKGRSGRKYDSDYFAMDAESWVVRKAKQGRSNETSSQHTGKFDESDERESRFKGRNVLSITSDL